MMGDSGRLEQPEHMRDYSEPYLIVGLGNPGSKHMKNRHNVGFMAVDRLAEAAGISMGRVQHRALFGKGEIAKYPVILAKPQTFMNRSGDSINLLARYYKIPPASVLVVYDELDLPLGSLRLRQKGGSGGHNGMKSVIQHLGNDFPRLRLGIGRPPGRMEPAAYVLRDFRKEELPIVNDLLDDAVAAIESFVQAGVDLAMTHHNKK
jgi:PTH1 family peptidyl-tRNA hydrolase